MGCRGIEPRWPHERQVPHSCALSLRLPFLGFESVVLSDEIPAFIQICFPLKVLHICSWLLPKSSSLSFINGFIFGGEESESGRYMPSVFRAYSWVHRMKAREPYLLFYLSRPFVYSSEKLTCTQRGQRDRMSWYNFFLWLYPFLPCLIRVFIGMYVFYTGSAYLFFLLFFLKIKPCGYYFFFRGFV